MHSPGVYVTPSETGELEKTLTATFRRFNRFYTVLIGSLSRDYLETEYNLQEARVIFELATNPGCTARDIESIAGFDQGYLSRIVARLTQAGVIRRVRSPNDRREQRLYLTKTGERAFKILDQRANDQARQLLGQLSPEARYEVGNAFQTIRSLLDRSVRTEAINIRGQKAGDLGWLLQRHAVLYKEEFRYSDLFESYVCQGLAPFMKNYDRKLDRLWIGELGGRPVGSVAVQHVNNPAGWAQLRWFLVEKAARGRGLGSQLLHMTVAFCRKAGYKGIFLWTVNDLHAARRLYERTGFTLVQETKSCAWAPWGREQKWEFRLAKG
jgi:DNA-binding MarR family transcriptional regulator/N-acetylglutamate synthase-like GNAT family acetyltransferase